MNYKIHLKRIYGPIGDEDGARVLVDRLWPVGLRRESLQLTDWYRDASPSLSLRRVWRRGNITQEDFMRRYRWELVYSPTCLVPLMQMARQGPLTLLGAARDPENSYLKILREAIEEALLEEDRQADGGTSSPPCYAGEFREY
ncbi:DUF488 domain-containing protein [Pistricoccus aurantiacus]|uniref:DUF488 domain-containing protein n=1 Tax=Pistricoccus aurantiacus TaxID=1883414 RepID=UPI00362CB2DC